MRGADTHLCLEALSPAAFRRHQTGIGAKAPCAPGGSLSPRVCARVLARGVERSDLDLAERISTRAVSSEPNPSGRSMMRVLLLAAAAVGAMVTISTMSTS